MQTTTTIKKGTMAKKKEKFLKLYKAGKLTQKEIAQKIKVSEKTVGVWVKGLPHKKYEKLRDSLQAKLQAKIDAKELDQTAVYNLTNSLSTLERLYRENRQNLPLDWL